MMFLNGNTQTVNRVILQNAGIDLGGGTLTIANAILANAATVATGTSTISNGTLSLGTQPKTIAPASGNPVNDLTIVLSFCIRDS